MRLARDLFFQPWRSMVEAGSLVQGGGELIELQQPSFGPEGGSSASLFHSNVRFNVYTFCVDSYHPIF